MIDYNFWLYILLIFARMLSFVSVAPFYSVGNPPPIFKAAFGLSLAILLYPAVSLPSLTNMQLLTFAVLLAGEVVVGLILGYTATLVFNSIRIAGQLLDIQIGLSMAAIFDPQSESQNTLLSQFLYTLAVLVYMLVDGHHQLLQSLAKSYELIPITSLELGNGKFVWQMVEIFSGVIFLALKIVGPVLAVLIIIDLSLTLVARTVPQLNVFMLAFPLKIGLGVLALAIVSPLLASVFKNVFTLMQKDLSIIMRYL
jgi:flagellar biosynthetic protein FliR